MVERACRDCKMITTKSRCPNCGSDRLSKDFTGMVIILDPENSEIAKIMGIKKPGAYALRVR
ncbi:transcription elongation factor Spt4 [Candidatus Bathyarchaeota archaeon ex4484_135]|nr:MAG: transcription elongation factor Spt4 [Candidatus Bathyarchaeota archaeon ex4484_135]